MLYVYVCAHRNPNPIKSTRQTGGGKGGGVSRGRWTAEEHEAFLQGLRMYGREWKRVAADIRTRTSAQIRSHAQKYFAKLAKSRPLLLQQLQAQAAAAPGGPPPLYSYGHGDAGQQHGGQYYHGDGCGGVEELRMVAAYGQQQSHRAPNSSPAAYGLAPAAGGMGACVLGCARARAGLLCVCIYPQHRQPY